MERFTHHDKDGFRIGVLCKHKTKKKIICDTIICVWNLRRRLTQILFPCKEAEAT